MTATVTATFPNPQELDCLRQAAEWRLLSLLFSRPGLGWQASIDKQAREVTDPLLLKAASSAQEAGTADEGVYYTIFGPGGPAAPREISYHETLQPGHLLAEIAAFFDAFGYRPTQDEPPDHVAVEAAFISWLHLKEAYALAINAAEQAGIAAAARRRFLSDHLAVLAGPLAQALESLAIGYLASAAGALKARAGLPPTSSSAPLFILPTEGCEFEDDQNS